MPNAQEWLDQNYPDKEERKRIKKFNINGRDKKEEDKLKGNLDLRDFVNLWELDVFDNRLTSLDISKNTNLIELCCSTNQLRELDLSQNTKLTILNCLDNQIVSLNLQNNLQLENIDVCCNEIKASLDIFSHLKKLERLHLGGGSHLGTEKNEFFGSLAILQGCESLGNLSIRKQRKVTGELKDLPVDTLKWLECEGTILEKEFGHAGLFEHWWAKEQLKEKDKELEQEREINTDVAEVMDR